MKLRNWLILFVILCSVLAVYLYFRKPYHSRYTSLEDDLCKLIRTSDDNPDAEMDYFTRECVGRDGYKIFIEGGDNRSWLDVEGKSVGLDTRHYSIFFPLGFFDVSGKQLEWRYKGDQLIGLIYEMSAMDTEEKLKSKFIVVKIEPERACVIGGFNSRKDSRKALESMKCID